MDQCPTLTQRYYCAESPFSDLQCANSACKTQKCVAAPGGDCASQRNNTDIAQWFDVNATMPAFCGCWEELSSEECFPGASSQKDYLDALTFGLEAQDKMDLCCAFNRPKCVTAMQVDAVEKSLRDGFTHHFLRWDRKLLNETCTNRTAGGGRPGGGPLVTISDLKRDPKFNVQLDANFAAGMAMDAASFPSHAVARLVPTASTTRSARFTIATAAAISVALAGAETDAQQCPCTCGS